MTTYRSKCLADTRDIGAELYQMFQFPSCVYLEGELGAGKTSLCQAIIQAAGYTGSITSPTYNLIHEYPVNAGTIYHMDLYRLTDPAELEYLGLEDLWNERSLFLIEWPEKGKGYLQPANHRASITKPSCGDDEHREVVFV